MFKGWYKLRDLKLDRGSRYALILGNGIFALTGTDSESCTMGGKVCFKPPNHN